jgi:excisionase family DNA binding protein
MEEQQFSLSEVAERLKISERTARRWIKSGKLRAYKPGRDYRIPEGALQELAEESEVRPKATAPPASQPSLNDELAAEERRSRPLLAEIMAELSAGLESAAASDDTARIRTLFGMILLLRAGARAAYLDEGGNLRAEFEGQPPEEREKNAAALEALDRMYAHIGQAYGVREEPEEPTAEIIRLEEYRKTG